jgi:Transposase IS4
MEILMTTNNRLGEDYEHKWYTAVKGFLRHVNTVSKNICKVPGTILSLDEMLRLFKGESANTERMTRKPDKDSEGFKFFALCDLHTAFVYDFFPCGRLFKRKTADHVKTLLKSLPGPQLETIDYVVAMDNFFTQPEMMKVCRKLGIGAFGTA